MRPASHLLSLLAVVLAVGCGASTPGESGNGGTGQTGHAAQDGDDLTGNGEDDFYADYDTQNITFIDDCQANCEIDEGLGDLVFVDRLGIEKRVADLAPDRHVVLVVTRGNTTPICPFCSTQTANYVNRYADFTERDAEVLLAYPIEFDWHRGKLTKFLENVSTRLDRPGQKVPFPVLFDVELKAVDHLGIRKDLSKPATYVLDRAGRVRFAYVGKDIDDRPSVARVLKMLDELQAEAPTADPEVPESSTP